MIKNAFFLNFFAKKFVVLKNCCNLAPVKQQRLYVGLFSSLLV